MDNLNCSNCNKKIDKESKFCIYCGNKIKNKKSSSNRKVKSPNNSVKKNETKGWWYLLLVILGIISIFIGPLIKTWTNTNLSIPVGTLITNITGVIIFSLLIIAFILDFYDMKKDKKKSKPFTKILANLCMIVFLVICIFFNIKNIYLSGKDIIEGTKEIEISEPEFLIRHTSGKGSSNYYYLVGNVNGKREKIEVKPRDSDYVEEKIKESRTVRIYYHENLKMFYKFAENYE